jgi:hypothetical protein
MVMLQADSDFDRAIRDGPCHRHSPDGNSHIGLRTGRDAVVDSIASGVSKKTSLVL